MSLCRKRRKKTGQKTRPASPRISAQFQSCRFSRTGHEGRLGPSQGSPARTHWQKLHEHTHPGPAPPSSGSANISSSMLNFFFENDGGAVRHAGEGWSMAGLEAPWQQKSCGGANETPFSPPSAAAGAARSTIACGRQNGAVTKMTIQVCKKKTQQAKQGKKNTAEAKGRPTRERCRKKRPGTRHSTRRTIYVLR